MNENSFVVVFPATFAQNKTQLLVENIKKILQIKNQEFSFVKKDGSIIIVKANDPVFASSAINLLFGIKRVAIARQVKNNFAELVSEITKIGSNLLLKGDRFFVKIEGMSKGFLPKDLEIAVTSSIIEKASKINAKPGTQENYDKLLYAFLTKSNAYVCIFLDTGLGGIPYGSQKNKAVSCVFDELSAISCLETIKQGFDVKIIVCYKKTSEKTNLIKMLNQIIPRTVSSNIELEFFKIKLLDLKDYLGFLKIVFGLLNYIAKKRKISHVSLPVSPLIHPSAFIDECVMSTTDQKLIPIIPLGGLDEDIFKSAKEIGLEKHLPRLEKLAKMKIIDSKIPKNKIKEAISTTIKSGQKLSVKVGPNNLHEILDSLQIDN